MSVRHFMRKTKACALPPRVIWHCSVVRLKLLVAIGTEGLAGPGGVVLQRQISFAREAVEARHVPLLALGLVQLALEDGLVARVALRLRLLAKVLLAVDLHTQGAKGG